MVIEKNFRINTYPGLTVGVRTDYSEKTLSKDGKEDIVIREVWTTLAIPFVEAVWFKATVIEGRETFIKEIKEYGNQ